MNDDEENITQTHTIRMVIIFIIDENIANNIINIK